MRLVDIRTLELVNFIENEVPTYAIVSHRWTKEELTFKEVEKKQIDYQKKGSKKLVDACRVAATYHVSYLWIDTCCIDKRSSAELSEAINSMFAWYKNAEICLAYLEDLESGPQFEELFKRSCWFTRSWTLQELLAPRFVDFFDREWTFAGSKESNVSIIQEVTGIADLVLSNQCPLWDCCIAVRMSWAALRIATRPEDIAYSLMGIFDVNMPLLYGEGGKAFVRLQEEIIRRTGDPTFLLWGQDFPSIPLLASSPSCFQNWKAMPVRSRLSNVPFTLTNLGLEIEAMLVRWAPNIYGMVFSDDPWTKDVVNLRKHPRLDAFYRTGVIRGHDRRLQWFRRRKLTLLLGNREQIFEAREDLDKNANLTKRFGFDVFTSRGLSVRPVKYEYQTFKSRREQSWTKDIGSSGVSCAFKEPMEPVVAKMECEFGSGQSLSIGLSFDFDSRPCALISRHNDHRLVWGVSDNIKDPNRHIMHEERTITSTMDERTGNTSYFLRADGGAGVFAELPEELTRPDYPVWASFTAPWNRTDNPHFWAFELSTTKPVLRGGPNPVPHEEHFRA